MNSFNHCNIVNSEPELKVDNFPINNNTKSDDKELFEAVEFFLDAVSDDDINYDSNNDLYTFEGSTDKSTTDFDFSDSSSDFSSRNASILDDFF